MLLRLVKKQSKQTYKDKEGNERHYINFYLVTDNGQYIPINPNPNIKSSYANLSLLADYVKD